MPNAQTQEKEFRTEMSRHLYHMHGFSAQKGQKISLEQLEQLHELLHVDEYALPPHSHSKAGAYEIGSIELTNGDNYILELVLAVRGDDIVG